MGRELPGEGTRKNDGSVAKGAKPGHEIKRTPVSASTVAASTQSRPAYNNANRKLQQQRRVATGTGSGKDFYATRSAQQRKAMRSAIGILRKSTRQQIEDLHQQRVRAFLALRAAAKFSSAPSSRKPTGLEARGLELAKRRSKRHDTTVAATLEPFHPGHLEGLSGSGKAKLNSGLLDQAGKVLKDSGEWTKNALLDIAATTGPRDTLNTARAAGGQDRSGGADVELSGAGDITRVLGEIGAKWGKKFVTDNNKTAGVSRVDLSKAGENLGRDLATFPAAAVSSAYVPTKQAAGLHFARALETLAGGYKDLVEDPGKTFTEHPASTALMVFGLKGALGRGAGGVMRHAPVRAVREAASTERAPKVLAGTHLAVPRRYSPDVFDKALQRLGEKHNERSAARLERKAQKATSPSEARKLRERAASKRTGRVDTRDIQRVVDQLSGARDDLARRNQVNIRRAVRATHLDEAAGIIAQNIAHPDRADLAAYRDELVAARDELESPAKIAANERLVEALDRSLRGFDAGHAKVAARRYSEIVRPLQDAAVKLGLLDRDQAEKAAWMPYARRAMGARHELTAEAKAKIKTAERARDRAAATAKRHPTESNRALSTQREAELRRAKAAEPQLVDERGAPLDVDAIKAHAKAHGVVNPPAWVSHAPAREVSASARLTEPAISSRGRSGAAAVEGTFDGSRHGLEDSAARTQALIDEAQAWRAHMQTLALRTGDGGVRRFASRDHADRAAADHNTSPGAVPMRPVRLTPLGSRRAQTQAALEHADSAELTSHVTDALRGALEGREDNGGGSWVLIPDTAARRLLAHLDVRSQASAAGKLGNVVTSMFRRTVLPLSPRWAMGNLVEGALRSAIAGAGPTNYLAGRRILKALDKLDAETGAQARAMVAPGGMYSLGLRGEVRRGLEDWSGDGHLDRFARRLIELREQSGPRQIAGAYRAYTDVVFTSMGWMESHFQTAMLGKALKQLNIREGGVGALSEKAMLEAADGLRGTSTQVELARRVSDMYGKYSGMSPGARRAIRTYAPFAPWWLSAVKFVTVVLPRDHPVLTGLIASNEQATREWRKDHNLEPYVDNSAPGWLQGSVPVGGGLLPLARYTPFGAFTDPAGTAAGQVLPQISGVLAALRGEDWTGKKLRGPDGKPLDDLGKARKAALAFIEGTIPGVQLGETIAKRGVGDALNPLRTYSKSVGSTDPLDALSKALSHTNSSTNLDAFSKALSKTNGN